MKDPRLSVQLLGDISFNGLLCDPLHQVDLARDLQSLEARLGSADLRLANWESPIAVEPELNPAKTTRLATTQEAARLIERLPLDVAVIGNNHIGDLNERGYSATRDYLISIGAGVVGAGQTASEALDPLIVERNGVSVAIVSFVGAETNPKFAEGVSLHVNELGDGHLAIKQVKELAAEHDHVIVSLHWGIEYMDLPSRAQRKVARDLVDAGASIVMGHHSHSPQPYELWRSGVIIYSLGNFIFSGIKGRETLDWPRVSQLGGAYEVVLSDRTPEIKHFPLLLSNTRVLPRKPSGRDRLKRQTLAQILRLADGPYQMCQKANALYVWGCRVPLFYVKARGGVWGAIRSVRGEHLRAFASSISATS